MSSEENLPLNSEERLKGIAYQFLKLYERWSEDRQVLNAHLATQAEMLKTFSAQLKNFESLEPQVRDQLVNNIHKAAKSISHEMGSMMQQVIGKVVTFEVESATKKLSQVINDTANTLKNYQANAENNLIKTIGITVGTTLVASLLIVWLLIPKPTLPLTGDQLNTYYNGQLLNEFWPKLSKKEQQHLTALAHTPDASQSNNNSVTSSDNSSNGN